MACVLAAWFYTGGKHPPYGYLGLGELFVFVFFGLVAVCGTAYVMLDRVPLSAVFAACAIGFLACMILVTNNLRDIDGDRESGKRTLATKLGDRGGTRIFFGGVLIAATAASVVAVALTTTRGRCWVSPSCRWPRRVPWRCFVGARGPALIATLKATGIAELVCAAGLFAGLILGA